MFSGLKDRLPASVSLNSPFSQPAQAQQQQAQHAQSQQQTVQQQQPQPVQQQEQQQPQQQHQNLFQQAAQSVSSVGVVKTEDKREKQDNGGKGDFSSAKVVNVIRKGILLLILLSNVRSTLEIVEFILSLITLSKAQDEGVKPTQGDIAKKVGGKAGNEVAQLISNADFKTMAKRILEIVESYVMSAVLYIVFGIPFEFLLCGVAMVAQAFIDNSNTASEIAFLVFGIIWLVLALSAVRFSLCFVCLCLLGQFVAGCCVYFTVRKQFQNAVAEAMKMIDSGEMPV